MCARRLLLIDADNEFHRILHEQVSPYGFEIYPVAENTDALSHIDSIGPELAFIAVEEPDKLGYSLCSRAKKGAYRELPIILTTASVPPSGFNSHRRLSVHADEYIDKRTMSGQELLDKIDALIGLAGGPAEMVEFDQVESISMVDELFGGEGEKTRIAPPDILMAADMARAEESMDSPFASERHEAGDGDGFFDEEDLKTTAFPVAAIPTMHGVPPVAGGPPPPHVGDHAPDQARLQEVERENERLRAELDKIRSSSDPGGASAFSREREFLNLREIINSKEKELNELRDEVDAKEREILDGKSESRQLQRDKTDLESRILGHEQQILGQNEQITELEAARQSGLGRIHDLENQLAARDQELSETRAQHAEQIASLESSHAAALEHQRQSDDAARHAEVGQLRNDYETQLAQLRSEGEQALQDAEAAREAALNEASTQHQARVAELESNHAAEVARLQQAQAEAERQAQDQLAATEAEHAQVKAGLEGEKAQLESELQSAHSQIDELATRFSDASDTIAERDAAIAENLSAIEARDQRIAELERDVAELEEQSTGYQDQILQAYKKIKSDEATVDKAKRAIAVALTLLDENIVDLANGVAGAPGDDA